MSRRMHGETAAAYAQRLAFAAKQKEFIYLVGPPIEISILCTCSSWRNPHELSAHKKLKGDWDWPTPEAREARERYVQVWDKSAR